MSIFTKYPSSSFLLALKDSPAVIDVSQRIADLFSSLDGLEDSNFGTAIDADPKARIWEMMVATILLESGLVVSGSGGTGPDFIIAHQGKTILVEAISPSLGEVGRPDSVPALEPRPDFQPVPVNPMLLRVRSALSDKKRAFDTYFVNRIISGDDARVIAISSAKLPQARGLWPCLGVTATLGYGGTCVTFDSRTGGRIEERLELQKVVRKANGSAVATLAFLNDDYSTIGGILYSESSPYSLNFALTEETYFIHNPKATHGIPPGTFKVGHELWTVLSSDGVSWKTYDIGPKAKGE